MSSHRTVIIYNNHLAMLVDKCKGCSRIMVAAEVVHSSGSLVISSISPHEHLYPFGLGIISSHCIISHLFIPLLSFALLSLSIFLMHRICCDQSSYSSHLIHTFLYSF